MTDITESAPRGAVPVLGTSVQSTSPSSRGSLRSRRRFVLDENDEDFEALLRPSGPYTPGGGLTKSLTVLFGLSVIMSLLLMWSNFQQLRLAQRLVGGDNVAHAELERNDARQLILELGNMALRIAIIVVFLFWFYRVHSNLKGLGATSLTYTSGWAVGYWFIPILNLVRPVQIAQEIWRHSDPATARRNHFVQTSSSSALVGMWWASWLVCLSLNRLAGTLAVRASTPEDLRVATTYALLAEAASIVASCLALAMIRTISARQDERAERLGLPTQNARCN